MNGEDKELKCMRVQQLSSVYTKVTEKWATGAYYTVTMIQSGDGDTNK
jgi:hypothetical protein